MPPSVSPPDLERQEASSWPPNLLWAITLAGCGALLMLGTPLFSLDPIYGFDTVHEKYFWREWVFESLRAGHVPAWCSRVLGGIPLISEPIVAFWYAPVAALHLLLPTGLALNLTWFLHFVIAAVGGYVLLVGRVGTLPALFGASSYAFGAWMVGHIPLGGLPHFAASAWTPWVFWSVLRVVETHRPPTARDAVVVALVTASCILGGHLQFVYATGLMVALFLMASVVSSWRGDARLRGRQLGTLVLALALALALASVMLVPWWEFHETSRRAAGLPEQFAYFGARMVPVQLFSVIAPTFFGDSVHDGYWGFPTQGMVTPYVGMPALVLALVCGAPRGRRREANTLRALALLGAVLAFGHMTPLYDFARTWIPFFDQARHPARWLHLTVFALAWLAALGLAGWRERGAGRREFIGAALVLLASASLWGVLSRGDAADGPWRTIFETRVDETTLPGKDPLRIRDRPALVSARARSLRSLAVTTGLTALTGMLLAAPLLRRRRNPAVTAGAVQASSFALVMLLLADLLAYGHRYSISFPRALVSGDPLIVESIGPPRVDQRSMTSVRGRTFPFPGAFTRSHAGLSGIGQAWMHRPMATGHLAAQGVFPTTPARWRDLIVGPFAFDPGYEALGPQGVRDLVAVDTWLTPQSEPPDAPGWTRVGSHDAVSVWHRDEPLARAFVPERCVASESDEEALGLIRSETFDPRAVVYVVGDCPTGLDETPGTTFTEIVTATDEALEIRVRTEGAALLVLSDNFFPGWEASVDERPTEILRVNVALRGVVVPSGEHRVRFEYHARSLRRGAALSGVGLAIVAFVLVTSRRRESR